MRHIAKMVTLTATLLVAGCGSETESFNFGFAPGGQILAAPTAAADTFQVLGNGILTGSVVANDTLNGATVTAFPAISNSGGTVAITAAGALTYTPPLNSANAVDTFTYTISNSVGSSTATVTVNIGARGLFVKNDVAVTGTGTQANPFKTLHEAVLAAPPTGGAIAIFRGDGTTTGLATAETIPTNVTVQAVDSANPPLLTGPLILSGNNGLTALNFSATATAAINATNSANGTLTAVNVTTTGNNAAALNNSTGTWTISNSRFANANLGALLANCSTGTLTWTVNNCTFNTNRVDIVGNLTAGGTANQTLTVTNNTFNNDNAGQAVGVRALATATNMTLTVTNNTVNGGGTALRGVDILSQSTCNVTASIKSNTFTGCTNEGILVNAQDTSNCAVRINNNTLTGNNLGGLVSSLVAGNNNTAALKLALDGNTANTYGVGGGAVVKTVMENLATLLSRNTGSFTTNDLVDGPCPAP